MAANTPVTLDFFSRQFLPLFDEKEVIQLDTVGQSVFGNPANGSQTVYSPEQGAFDYEVVRGNERLASFVPRGSNGRFVGSAGATQPHVDLQVGVETYFTRKYPLIEEEGTISADFLLNRVPGEGPFEGRSRSDRFRFQANRIFKEAFRRIIRLDEYLAWQSILTGKQPQMLNNTTDVYDFRRNTSNTVTVGTAWSGAGTPLTDIDSICDQILSTGKVMPDMAFVGGVGMRNFLGNSQITTVYGNKLFYDLVRVGIDFQPDGRYGRFIAAGAIPYGQLRTPKGYTLVLFTYPKGYTNASGTYTKYLGDNSMVIMSSGARMDRYFGPAERLPMTAQDTQLFMERMGFNPMTPAMPQNVLASPGVIAPETFFADFYKATDKKKATLRVQHAPVFATTQTDAIGVLNGL